MDEAYVKLKGQWFYYYDVVNSSGNTIDFYLCDTWDEVAAKSFFEKAIARYVQGEKVNIDKSSANMVALAYLDKDLPDGKKITKVMIEFKTLIATQAILRGIELWYMIKKLRHLAWYRFIKKIP